MSVRSAPTSGHTCVHQFGTNALDFESHGVFLGKWMVVVGGVGGCESQNVLPLLLSPSFCHQHVHAPCSALLLLRAGFVNCCENCVLFMLLQDGMGHLKMVPEGIQLNGEAMVHDTLRASKIR